MKIELIRGTVIEGKGYDAGAVVDVDDSLGSMLMATGKGVPHAERAAKSDRSVGLSTSDTPKAKTRSKAKK
jgi:hypothetical protein